MADKAGLRLQRVNMVINTRSACQEKAMDGAIRAVEAGLKAKFPGIRLHHAKEWKLQDVVKKLRRDFPAIDFHYFFAASAMRPDGGILSLVSKAGERYPILIAEKKNQGTNDLRAAEGTNKQPRGNAIERLGKNVIGFRTAMKTESIFPFVCFGDGCDFHRDSSILDRVVTIAQFGDLSWDKEYELACPVDRIGKVNLLLVTQHGSAKVSSNPAQLKAMRPDVAIMANGGKKGGDADPIKVIKASPGLMALWQTHDSYAHPEWTKDKNYVANLNPPAAAIAAHAKQMFTSPPDEGHAIHAEITKDGKITMTNDRNGFSKTYQAAP